MANQDFHDGLRWKGGEMTILERKSPKCEDVIFRPIYGLVQF